jgi:hypothetical protein
MNFEQPPMPPAEEPGENQAERVEIKNTTSFQEALESGNLETAENWLDKIKAERPENYDDRWIDHRERELFKAYYAQEDWASAKRIVEGSIKPDSKEGRKTRLEQLSGQPYDEI